MIGSVKWRHYLLLSLMIGVFSLFAHSQEINITTDDETPIEERILYSRQNAFRIVAQTQGFGVGFNFGKIRNIYSTRIWDFEATTLFSLKKVSIINPYMQGAKPYVYGKLNNAFVIRAGYGNMRRISGKPYWGGVETRLTYEGGLSLALLKPYYYYVVTVTEDDNGDYSETYEYQTFDQRDNWIEIIGRAPFFEGISGIRLSPGVNAKVGLNFEFAKSEARVRALETGLMLEVYPMGVSLMDDMGELTTWKKIQKRAFMIFYISFNIGSRYNKY